MAKQTLEWSGPIEVRSDFREGVAHGDPLFPMSVHHTRVPPDQKMVLYYHWHEELELLFLTRGEARFQLGSQRLTAGAGDVLLIPPNQVHGATRQQAGEVEFFAVLIHFGFVASLGNDLAQQRYLRPLFDGADGYPARLRPGTAEHGETLALLEGIRDLYREEPFGYELLLKSRVHELFYRLALCRGQRQEAQSREPEPYNTQRIRQVIRYIEDNYRGKIALADAARQLNMSEGHFCRFFKEQVGMTLVEYLNGYRLAEAARLIRSGDQKLTDVAMECGFGNVNYFTTAFKRTFACTPMEYRQRHR